jgi:MFS family permease
MPRAATTYFIVYGLYCSSWSWLMAIYPLFLLSRGLDLFEINIVFSVYLITAFSFEVPTGAVADVLGRKVSFLFSCLLRGCAFGLYWFADSFVHCLIAELIDAIGTTLATGALDAWVVDAMKEEGDRRPAGPIFARAAFIASPMMIVAGVLGGYAGDVDIALPWVFGASTFLLTGLAGVVLMREARVPPAQHGGTWTAWIRTTRQGLITVRRQPVMLALCLLTGFTAFATMPAWHYWPARLQEVSGGGTWLLGWAWALISLAGMAGNWLMPRLVRRYRREHVLMVAWTWRAAMLGGAALSGHLVPTFLAIVAMQAVWGLSEPALQGWMNENVDSAERATVLSVRSMSFTLGGGLGLIFLGLIGRAAGIPAVWGAAALLLLLVAPGFLLLKSAVATHPATATPSRPSR